MKNTVKLSLVVIALLFSMALFSQVRGDFAPGADYDGTSAIHKGSQDIVSWATGVELYRGYTDIAVGTTLASHGINSNCLGYSSDAGFVSLGDGGVATLTFDRPIINGDGPDFAVFENAFEVGGSTGIYFLELAFVEVSSDGINFVRFPAISNTDGSVQIGGFGGMDPTNIYNLAGKYQTDYGTPFDLDDIADSANIDVNNIRFVRIIDVVGNITPEYASYDSQGNIINDPYPTNSASSGFDLDGVAVINGGTPYNIADMNDLTLAPNSYWNGADQTGFFESSIVRFANENSSGFWSGFAYSNMTDITTAGFTNQFSSITGGGMNANTEEGTNFAVGYVMNDYNGAYDPIPIELSFTDNAAHEVSGFYVTNATYAVLSMENGDGVAKKFGGDTGSDPDWFKLYVWGTTTENTLTDTIEFSLADYTFEDNTEDYIVKNWRWVELSSLGAVKTLHFSLMSTDVGDWGMNTPAYFCLDNLVINKYGLIANPINNIWAYADDENLTIDLDENFAVGDNDVNYQIINNNNPDIASAAITNSNLKIDFISAGQSTIIFSATYEETTIYDTIVVGVLPVIDGEFDIVDFEDLELEEDSFWNGSDETGYFNSGMAIFENSYNSGWESWSGWAYSNVNNVETPGYLNQYAAYTGQGLDTLASGGTNYGISNPYTQSVISFVDEGNYTVKGIYVTNSTYASLSMKTGDIYAKKFGGENGNDEDWFMLTITGMHEGTETGSVDYYLADYRFEDNNEDYIIETWQYVELSELGQVDTLLFSLSSSDVGDGGMNTPGYFCVDNLMFTYEEVVNIDENIAENVSVYPNPASSYIMVETQSEASVNIYSIEGRLVLSQIVNNTEMLDVSSFKSGMYTMGIETANGRTVKKLIIN